MLAVPLSNTNTLPPPDANALAISTTLLLQIRAAIAAAGGWLPFERYMHLALYAPGLGYYSAGSHKLGAGGDFTTAPEQSTLFGQTVAQQLVELIHSGLDTIIELGAGSGALAHSVLLELAQCNALPDRYAILEVSPDLRARQHTRLQTQLPPALFARIDWLDTLPSQCSAAVIANEVLDAIPSHRVRLHQGQYLEQGVVSQDQALAWDYRPATGALLAAAQALGLDEGYETEINLAAQALIADLGTRLNRGVILCIDYGFPAHEYYHPQRNQGTLMCHYRHHAHTDALLWPGLQDITTHVNFSAIAKASPLLTLCGYTQQAQFLINCGITDLLSATDPRNTQRYLPLATQAQTLLSPAEMGELFKVIALGRHWDGPLRGFSRGDKSHTWSRIPPAA